MATGRCSGFLSSSLGSRVILGKRVAFAFSHCFYHIFSTLAGNEAVHINLDYFEILSNPTRTTEIAAQEHM